MKLLLSILIISTLTSCGFLARELVAGKQCKKCEITDPNGLVVWMEDGCGGEVHNMELRAKATAYDFGCGHKLGCVTYKEGN